MHCRVLVADDDPDLLQQVLASLTDAGAEAVGAASGAELLERLAEEGPFDLVITDLSMPWFTGFQVTHSVREAGLEIPVIVMTGHRGAALRDQVRSLGARVALLEKPFDAATLRAAVAHMLPDLASTGLPPTGTS
jgi:CheY-like chemotaxis protein